MGYKYNPLNTLVFGWTQSPVTVGGYPTTRYSEVKIIYHPTRSATKEIEAEVALGAVYKKHSYVVEYKPETLGVIAPKQVLEKLNVESGVAVSGELKVILKGGSPKKYSFTLIGGQLSEQLSAVFNLLFSQSQQFTLNMSIFRCFLGDSPEFFFELFNFSSDFSTLSG